MRSVLMIMLAVGCVAKDATTVDSDSGADSAIEPLPTFTYDVTSADSYSELYWSEGSIPYGGYAGHGAKAGFYVSDPVGDGESAFIYRIPWVAESGAIESSVEVTLTTQTLGPDKIGYDSVSGLLSIPNAAATVDGIEGAGIGYALYEPARDQELSDAAAYAFGGANETGYTGRVLSLDADADGSVDDMIVTATADNGDFYGEIGVWLNVEPGHHTWGTADFSFDSCEDHEDTRLKYGPVDLAVDANGSVLYVACPSSTYKDGSVEGFSLPLTAESVSFGYLYGVGGWTIDADPRGGVWAGSQGSSSIAYVSADFITSFGAVPISDGVDLSYFGSNPVVVETSGGQVFMVVGQQTRTADSVELFMPTTTPVMPPGFDPGDVYGMAEESTDTSAVWICDITEFTEPSRITNYAYLSCSRYEADAIGCVGGVQGAFEADGALNVASAGWEFGSGDGCGLKLLQFSGVEVAE